MRASEVADYKYQHRAPRDAAGSTADVRSASAEQLTAAGQAQRTLLHAPPPERIRGGASVR
eukprot:5967415-Prymnesium_polylepis.1